MFSGGSADGARFRTGTARRRTPGSVETRVPGGALHSNATGSPPYGVTAVLRQSPLATDPKTDASLSSVTDYILKSPMVSRVRNAATSWLTQTTSPGDHALDESDENRDPRHVGSSTHKDALRPTSRWRTGTAGVTATDGDEDIIPMNRIGVNRAVLKTTATPKEVGIEEGMEMASDTMNLLRAASTRLPTRPASVIGKSGLPRPVDANAATASFTRPVRTTAQRVTDQFREETGEFGEHPAGWQSPFAWIKRGPANGAPGASQSSRLASEAILDSPVGKWVRNIAQELPNIPPPDFGTAPGQAAFRSPTPIATTGVTQPTAHTSFPAKLQSFIPSTKLFNEEEAGSRKRDYAYYCADVLRQRTQSAMTIWLLTVTLCAMYLTTGSLFESVYWLLRRGLWQTMYTMGVVLKDVTVFTWYLCSFTWFTDFLLHGPSILLHPVVWLYNTLVSVLSIGMSAIIGLFSSRLVVMTCLFVYLPMLASMQAFRNLASGRPVLPKEWGSVANIGGNALLVGSSALLNVPLFLGWFRVAKSPMIQILVQTPGR